MQDIHNRREHGVTALERLIELRLSRRDVLKGAVAALGATVSYGCTVAPRRGPDGSTLLFSEIGRSWDHTHHVPPGYNAQVLVRWGDPVVAGAPALVPGKADPDAQEKQFGYDNDFLAFMPLPHGSGSSAHGLLCANHERCTQQLMWPGMDEKTIAKQMTAERCAHEMASQGFSIVEVRRDSGRWRTISDGRYNRRITARSARIRIGGPATGHARMRTSADPEGRTVIGTLNNCAGGVTPWGTVLTCEENIHGYFLGQTANHREAAALKRYGIDGRPRYQWGRYFDRFNLEQEPNESNRFGWVVEIDPYDPQSTPVKRTALGRFKHEGATAIVSHDGRVVVYMGDDERFEYLYKFVTTGTYRADNPTANRDLLDHGTLYVARFDAGGKMRWLPLVHGQGPLTAANGFASQADVVIEARRAADLVGATTMDRPEDVESNPLTGRVYVVMTNNNQRKPEQIDAANPRADNRWGQIIELVPPDVNGRPDHTATENAWEFFLIAGDPADAKHSARYLGPVSSNGWLACPDNVAFDRQGRIWISTDGQRAAAGFADSVYAADTAGPGRGITRLFLNGPRGAEMTGPCFTPDSKTFFVSVQHPGDERGSTYDKPSTRWPDFQDGMPPRPAVLAVTKADGGEIGS
jgi:secreted PhoX family phosphatase